MFWCTDVSTDNLVKRISSEVYSTLIVDTPVCQCIHWWSGEENILKGLPKWIRQCAIASNGDLYSVKYHQCLYWYIQWWFGEVNIFRGLPQISSGCTNVFTIFSVMDALAHWYFYLWSSKENIFRCILQIASGYTGTSTSDLVIW